MRLPPFGSITPTLRLPPRGDFGGYRTTTAPIVPVPLAYDRDGDTTISVRRPHNPDMSMAT